MNMDKHLNVRFYVWAFIAGICGLVTSHVPEMLGVTVWSILISIKNIDWGLK
jgi:hypothetical protein